MITGPTIMAPMKMGLSSLTVPKSDWIAITGSTQKTLSTDVQNKYLGFI